MNYRHVYCVIISHAKSEEKLGIRAKGNGNYYERHHILPKSLFPLWKNRKSNIVLLTAREHFFCHQLLEKIYPNSGMFLALWRLATDGQNKYCSSREYQKLKEKYYITEEHKKHIKETSQRYWKSDKCEETRKKIKEARKNQKNLAWGKRSEESKQRMREAIKLAMSKEETREKHSNAQKENWKNPELRQKYLENMKKAMNDPERKKLISQKTKDFMKKKVEEYNEYKRNGGKLNWNEYRKATSKK